MVLYLKDIHLNYLTPKISVSCLFLNKLNESDLVEKLWGFTSVKHLKI